MPTFEQRIWKLLPAFCVGGVTGAWMGFDLGARLTPHGFKQRFPDASSVRPHDAFVIQNTHATAAENIEVEGECDATADTRSLSHSLLVASTRGLRYAIDCASDRAKRHALCAAEWGLPSAENLRFFQEYVSSVDFERRVPKWTLEFLTADDFKLENEDESEDALFHVDLSDELLGSVSRGRSQWHADGQMPAPFFVDAWKYSTPVFKALGLSRGHLAAAGNHDSSQGAKDDTFSMPSNVVPQELTMNGCQWYALETFLREVLTNGCQSKRYKNAWIVSGPIFNNQTADSKPTVEYKLCSADTRVAIPTHLFKVVVFERANDSEVEDTGDVEEVEEKASAKRCFEIACFVQKNAPLDDVCLTAAEFSDAIHPLRFVADVSDLESRTGLCFFRRLRNATDEDISVVDFAFDDAAPDFLKEKTLERAKGWYSLALLRNEALSLEQLLETHGECEAELMRKKEPKWRMEMQRKAFEKALETTCDKYQATIDQMRTFA